MRGLRASLENLDHDVHAKAITGHFGGEPGAGQPLPDEVRNTKVILICFTNRCGSNYLAELLASTGKTNLGGEVFNYNSVIKQSEKRQFRGMRDYVAFLIKKRAKDGCLVAKASVGQLHFLKKIGVLDDFTPEVSYILLERGNKIAQSVSYMIASQTKQWASYQQPVAGAEPVFDAELALNFLEGVCRAQALFDAFFAVNGIAPVLASYETLVARPRATVAGILAECGIPGAVVKRSQVRTERQADPVNEAFERELRRRIAALG